MVMGTFCAFSERRCAVTITCCKVEPLPVSVAAGATGPTDAASAASTTCAADALKIAAIVRESLRFDFMHRPPHEELCGFCYPDTRSRAQEGFPRRESAKWARRPSP